MEDKEVQVAMESLILPLGGIALFVLLLALVIGLARSRRANKTKIQPEVARH